VQNKVFGCIKLEKPVLSPILLPLYVMLDVLWVYNAIKFGINSKQMHIIIHKNENIVVVHQEKGWA